MDDLQEAYLSVYEDSDIKSRAKAAVDHRLPESYDEFDEGYVELNRKRQNRMTDQTLRHMKRGSDDDWEKIYKIEDQRDTQTPEVSKAKSSANRNRPEAEKRSKTVKETVDLYDVVLDYLLDEGYANTEENALTIMANMSEAWIDGILDEAQIMSVYNKDKGVIKKINPNILRLQNAAARERQERKERERSTTNTQNTERIAAARKTSIQTLNAKPGADSGDYDSGYHGDGDTSDGKRHYGLSHTNRSARSRRAKGQ